MLSTGLLFWFDRQISPRVWVPTVPVDPNLPIRGRYITLNMVVPFVPTNADVSAVDLVGSWQNVQLRVEADQLQAVQTVGAGLNNHGGVIRLSEGLLVVNPGPELAFFIPPDVKDPSIRPDGSTLWVEVTLPGLGAPRPIQLGIEKDGQIEPLALR
tara:strand:- start:325 stop:792 length:468 start_codon:yes stop_codon:yes gene_type:complete